MQKAIIAGSLCLVLFVSVALAETNLNSPIPRIDLKVRFTPDGEFYGSATYYSPVTAMPTTAGAPYAADEFAEQVQILADGNRITSTLLRCRVYRDSEGRIRKDQSPFTSATALRHKLELPVVSEIWDPVAGYQYFLDASNRVAHRFKIPPLTKMQHRVSEELPYSKSHTMGIRQEGEATIERKPLETREIEGVLARGVLQTTTIPAGRVGNEKPIVIIDETWDAIDLKITILHRTIDPRFADIIRVLGNFDLSEPDPELFKVPSGYTVINETDVFTLTFGDSVP